MLDLNQYRTLKKKAEYYSWWSKFNYDDYQQLALFKNEKILSLQEYELYYKIKQQQELRRRTKQTRYRLHKDFWVDGICNNCGFVVIEQVTHQYVEQDYMNLCINHKCKQHKWHYVYDSTEPIYYKHCRNFTFDKFELKKINLLYRRKVRSKIAFKYIDKFEIRIPWRERRNAKIARLNRNNNKT